MQNKTQSVFFTMFGLGCFVGLLFIGGFDSFEKITRPSYSWLFAAVIGTGLMVYIYSTRWGGIVNSIVGYKVAGALTYYFYSLSSLVLGTFLPHGAVTTLGRAAVLKKIEGISWKKSGASVLLDKIFDGFFMLMFSWPLLLLLMGKATVNQVVVISMAEFAVISLLVIIHYTLWIQLLKFIIELAVKSLALLPVTKRLGLWRKLEAIHQLDEWDVLQKRIVLRAYFLTAAGQVMLAVRAWMAAMVVGLPITPLDTFVAIGLVQASILISLTPGALGFADAAWFIALSGAGVPKDSITVFLVAFRIIENVAILICWLPLYLCKIWNSGRNLERWKKKQKIVQHGTNDVE